MEAAARSSIQVRRAKRPGTTATAQIIDVPAAGIEASPRRGRRIAAQIGGIPSRRTKTLNRRPCSTPPNWCVRRARSPRCLRKRPRIDLLPCPVDNHNWRDWSDLGDGPAGLIAERVLAFDVADYVRFRAVCRPWRQCSSEPRGHSGLDRRFHPWRWTMLREKPALPDRRRFLNRSTGQCIQVHIPELRDHELVAVTSEGLLILVRNPQRTAVSMLNPLTRHLTDLPPFTTLLPSNHHNILSWCNFGRYTGCGFVIGNGDSMLVLCLNSLGILGMAKPGDVCWTLLKFDGKCPEAFSMFAGSLYCVTGDGVMVLEDQPPRLELVAELPMLAPSITDSVHLVDCDEDLMLVHRRFSRKRAWNNVYKRRFDAYRVDLDAGTMCRVNSFGGGRIALFIGTCSFSVPIKAFPSGSIRGDTIYLSFDIDERDNIEGYNLVGKRMISSCNQDCTSSVAGPHTLVDCLSFV